MGGKLEPVEEPGRPKDIGLSETTEELLPPCKPLRVQAGLWETY